MGNASLDDLLQVAAEIMDLEAAEPSLGKGREWKAAKRRYEAAKRAYQQRQKSYVNGLLERGMDWAPIPATAALALDAIEREANGSFRPAVAYMRANLIPYLTREAGKTPLVRDIARWAPAGIWVVVIVAGLVIHAASEVAITAPLDTKAGLQQRAAATEKVLRYRRWRGDYRAARNDGWQRLILWPIEPSREEAEAAAEFVRLTYDVYGDLLRRRVICDAQVHNEDGSISSGRPGFVEEVANDVQRADLVWRTPPAATIIEPLEARFPCRSGR